MASNQTTNYGLNQWDAEDEVLRTEFNEDNAKLDAALGTLAGQVAGKAEQSALNTLSQTHTADVAALRSENCWIKLAESTLTAAANTVTLMIPQAAQLQKVVLEFSTSGPEYLIAYPLTQTDLAGGVTPSSSIAVASRCTDLAGGRMEIFPAGPTGIAAAFSQYLSIDGSYKFDGVTNFYGQEDVLFQDLAAIRIQPSTTGQTAPMVTGSRFVLYGLKK